jgi:hypothetical protein
MRSLSLALLAGLALGLSGCVGHIGIIYTHTFEPLTTNFDRTPAASDRAGGDTKQLDYSYLRVLWSGNGIGEIAKENGFETVYYADLETLRVLGIWTQEWAHVYGIRKPDPASAVTK